MGGYNVDDVCNNPGSVSAMRYDAQWVTQNH